MKKLLIIAGGLAAAVMIAAAVRSSPEMPEAEKPSETGAGGLPVLYLTIDSEEFKKVNESEDHSYRAESGSLSIKVPEGYTGDYSKDVLLDTDELEISYIRGRGHGTWAADKKPYKIKLKESADLLGMGRSKTWVLLANRYDETFMRNRLINYIGTAMGLPYTPQSEPVDVMVNGEYYGCYHLSEQVQIGSSRVDIDELQEEDIREPEITGGYLISMFNNTELENGFYTDRMINFGSEEPDFTERESGQEEQKQYIAGYVQKTEDAIFGDNFCDSDGISYSEYMDMRSAADYWWIQEFSANHDGFKTSSTYLYKEREGKLFWGPLWDFDLAFDCGFGGAEGFDNCPMDWLDYLRAYDPAFQELLRERWKVLDGILEDVTAKGGVIDRYVSEIRGSYKKDFERWPVTSEDGRTVTYNLAAEAEELKTWIDSRRRWINRHIDDKLTDVFYEVSFAADGKLIAVVPTYPFREIDPIPAGPEKAGYVFAGWECEDRAIYPDDGFLEGDTTFNAVYVPASEAVLARGIDFDEPEAEEDIHAKRYEPSYEIVPENADEKTIIWESSDPEIAEVDEGGKVTMKKTGTVTITGRFHSGAAGSYTLRIYDSLTEQS